MALKTRSRALRREPRYLRSRLRRFCFHIYGDDYCYAHAVEQEVLLATDNPLHQIADRGHNLCGLKM
jgi:DNA-directed RNA polymerase specialized sigma24 family protein